MITEVHHIMSSKNGKIHDENEKVYLPVKAEDEFKEEICQKPSTKGEIKLFIVACAACSVVFGCGSSIVWTSPMIARLASNDTTINPLGRPATTAEISLISGLLPFGGMVSPLLSAKACDAFGRKPTTMFLSLILLILSAVLAFARNIYLYYICRFSIGFANAAVITTMSIFLSEIGESHNRGKIGCLIGFFLPFGSLFLYVVGPMYSTKVFTLLCTAPFALSLLAFLYIPESPVYLASKGKGEACIRSLGRLRCKTADQIEKEYESIIYTLQQTSNAGKGLIKTMVDICKVPSYRRGLVIATGCIFAQCFSGVLAIMAFAAPIFDEARCGISGDMVGILIGAVKVFTTFTAATVVERAGRRPLLLTSSFGSACSLFVLGLFFYLQSVKSDVVENIRWLPVATIVTFFVLYSLGIGVIPMAIMGELFPSNIKATAVSMVSLNGTTFAFITLAGFPILKSSFGPTWCMWSFSFTTFLGFIFIYFKVPEIKGKSFLEIQEMLSKK